MCNPCCRDAICVNLLLTSEAAPEKGVASHEKQLICMFRGVCCAVLPAKFVKDILEKRKEE